MFYLGLGKTAQVCAHFGSLGLTSYLTEEDEKNDSEESSTVKRKRKPCPTFLVVAPPTVISHWVREFHLFSPYLRCLVLHSVSQRGKDICLLPDQGIFYFPNIVNL